MTDSKKKSVIKKFNRNSMNGLHFENRFFKATNKFHTERIYYQKRRILGSGLFAFKKISLCRQKVFYCVHCFAYILAKLLHQLLCAAAVKVYGGILWQKKFIRLYAQCLGDFCECVKSSCFAVIFDFAQESRTYFCFFRKRVLA